MRMSYSSWPIFAVPPGSTTFCAAIAVENVRRRETLGLQQLRIEVQHDGPLLAAVDVGDDGAWNGDQLRPDEVQAEVVQLLLGEPSCLRGRVEESVQSTR